MLRRFLTFTFSIIFFIWSVDWKSLPFVAESDRGALRPIAAANSKGKISDLEGAGPEAVKLYLMLTNKETPYHLIKSQLIELLKGHFFVSPQEDFQEFLQETAASIEAHHINALTKSTLPDKTMARIFAKNIINLLKGVKIEKDAMFLEEFRNNRSEEFSKVRPFINTDEIIKPKEEIPLSEMLKRYSNIHPDILPDPDEVLALVQEYDWRIIIKEYYPVGNTDFFEQYFAGQGQYYWVLYRYPCPKLEAETLTQQEFAIEGWEMLSQEREQFDAELCQLARDASRGRDRDEVIDEWLAFCDFTNANITTSLDAMKRLLLYIHNSFGDTQPIDMVKNLKFQALVRILKRLMQDPEVEDWTAGFIKSCYLNGSYMEKPRSRTYRKEFEVLLSILIDRNRKEVIPIAIHIFMDKRYPFYLDYTEGGKIDMIADSIFKSDHPELKKAIFFKCLSGSDYPLFFIKRVFGEEKPKEIYSYAQSFAEVIYEILKYFSLVLPRRQLEDVDGYELISHQASTSTKFGNIIVRIIHEKTIMDLLSLLLKEDNPKVRRRLVLLLDEALFSKATLSDYKSAAQRWIDLAIHFATKYNMPLKDWYSLAKVAEAFPDYRKEELQRWMQGQLQQAEVKVKAAQSLICNSPAISAAFSASA